MAPLDLSLPSKAPELGGFGNMSWDDASFALYTLVNIPEPRVQEIASSLEKQWLDQGNEDHLVRPAPTHNFSGKTLKDVVNAHIALDKDVEPRDDGGAEGNLGWWPTAFIVVTKEDWENRGLLFVFADDEEDGCPMDKFFFLPKDAYMMLSSLSFGNEELARSKEIYAVGAGQ